MRCKRYLTELKVDLSLPTAAIMWLAAAVVFGALYALRAIVEVIPAEEHVIFSLSLCTLLSLIWINLEQTCITLSFLENRCRLKHYRLGTVHEKSLPVSQIHSAKIEFETMRDGQSLQAARIVLITSLGMIPLCSAYGTNTEDMHQACDQINEFLATQSLFLQA